MNLAAAGNVSYAGTTSSFEDTLPKPKQPNNTIQSAVIGKSYLVESESNLKLRFKNSHTPMAKFDAGKGIKGTVSYDAKTNEVTIIAEKKTDGRSEREIFQTDLSPYGVWLKDPNPEAKLKLITEESIPAGLLSEQEQEQESGIPSYRTFRIGDSKIRLGKNASWKTVYQDDIIGKMPQPNKAASVGIATRPGRNFLQLNEVHGVHRPDTTNVTYNDYRLGPQGEANTYSNFYRPVLAEHKSQLHQAIKLLSNNPKKSSVGFKKFEEVFKGLKDKNKDLFLTSLQTAMHDKLLSSATSSFGKENTQEFMNHGESDRAKNALELIKLSFAPRDVIEATQLVFGKDERNKYVQEAERYLTLRPW